METGIIKLNPELMALLHGNGGADIMPFRQEIFVLNVFIDGTGYCERIKDILPHLSPGMQLTLRRQPDNEVDEFAIGIYDRDTRIGWVPMKDNLVIARLMDAGKLFTCKIVRIDENGGKWPKINVSIYMVD